MSNPIDIQNAIAMLNAEGYAITPPVVNEKIKLTLYGFNEKELNGRLYKMSYMTNVQVPLELSPKIKQAIENVLNDTVVEDKANITNEQLGRMMYNIHQQYKAREGAMMEDTWKAARRTCFIGADSHCSFKEWKATLPLQQEENENNVKVLVTHGSHAGQTVDINSPIKTGTEDKPFVWTDELVAECHEYIKGDTAGILTPVGVMKNIQLFKQSKQSPTNLQESKADYEIVSFKVKYPPHRIFVKKECGLFGDVGDGILKESDMIKEGHEIYKVRRFK